MRTDPGVDAVPLVSVLITAHNRPDDLRETLRSLRQQDYPALELVLIDDASSVDLEPVVRAEWPEVRFTRNERNLGLIASRSSGMRAARGEYILTLDDDSCPVDRGAISRAVHRFGQEPALGILAFRIHEGLEAPPPEADAPPEQYTHSFIGCGEMMRAAVARDVGGYRDLFEYYKEEEEFAIRALDRGWRILYFPDVLVHHRLSPIGRSDARITAYTFRNSLWTVLLLLPFPRMLADLAWKAMVGGTEMLRQGNVRWLVWALASFVRGLPRVLRARRPVSRGTARTYDALRFRRLHSIAALEAARPPSLAERWRWFRDVWMQRRRARSFWSRGSGGVGRGAWTTR